MTTSRAAALAAELGVSLRDMVEAAGFEWVVDTNHEDRRLVMTSDLELLVATIRLDGFRFDAVDSLGRHAQNLLQFRGLLADHTTNLDD